MTKPMSEWTTRELVGFVQDELEGSTWSSSLFPEVTLLAVIAEILRRVT